MNDALQRTAWVLLAAALIAGCSPAALTSTGTISLDNSPTPVPLQPSATSVPPTSTPTQVPTPTPTRTLLPPVETIRNIAYVPDGAPEQVLDLYLPPEAAEPAATLLLFHGGGAGKGDMASLAVSLARQGYAAAALEFRDYPRFTYTAGIEDAFCGLAWLYANADRYHLDSQHFFSLGHSLGGSLSAMLGVLDDPAPFLTGCPYELPATGWIHGAIAYTGIFDYTRLSSSSDLIVFANTYLGSTWAEDPALWSQASPISWIDAGDPPFLVVHGEADHSIPIEQSEGFVVALQAAGVQAELLLVPGATHESTISNPLAMEALGAFLAANQETTLPETSSLTVTTLVELAGTYGPVYSLAWAPDGSQIASAGYGQVNLWDGEDYSLLATLPGHTSYVWGVAWAPDGTVLASGCQDGSVRLWDPFTASEMAALHDFFTFEVAWSPDGSQLASGNIRDTVMVWDVASGEPRLEMISRTDSETLSLAWSPDGSTLAAGYLNGEIILWSAASGARILTIQDYTRMRSDTNGVAWSLDGRRLVSAHEDGVVRVWDAASGELLQELRGHGGFARGLAWSPDGRWLATTGYDGTLQVWDVDSGVRLANLWLSPLAVWSASWSPDGSRIAVGTGTYDDQSTPGMVLVVSVSTGQD